MVRKAVSGIKFTLVLIGAVLLLFSGFSRRVSPGDPTLTTAEVDATTIDIQSTFATTSSAWYIETIDTTGNVGKYSSLALDSNDTVYISYAAPSQGLKVAQWNGTIWNYEIADTSGCRATSMTFDSRDRPHISYQVGGVTGDLKYATKVATKVGTTWINETVDASGDISGASTSIAVNSKDYPHISYRDFINQDLEYAWWNGSAWNLESPDWINDVGERPSLALDSKDRPHISYFCDYDDWFRYIRWNGTTWNKDVVDTADNGRYNSLKLDSANNPHISYYDNLQNDLVYNQWNGTVWNREVVDGVGVQVGRHSSLALDSREYPHISYYDTTNQNLKYAWWNGTAWNKETIDATGSVGIYTSIALDSGDNPHISYYDEDNQDLKYATVASPGRDVRVYGGVGPQNEVSIAVNPLNPDNIVVGFNDWVPPTVEDLGGWGLSYSYSINGGVTWTYGGRVDQGIQLEGEPWCDPWLAFDNEGYLFYVGLSDSFTHEIFIAVGKPDNSGNVGPFGFRTEIVDAGDAGPNDKPVIAVDTTNGPWDGQFYVAWSQSPGNIYVDGFRIWLRRGTRVPGTDVPSWAGPPQQVSPDTFTQLPQVAVGPSGQVYVAYQKQNSPALASAWAHFISSSTDGGATFIIDTFVTFVAAVEVPVSPGSWARCTSGSTLGISPDTGTMFLAWTDSRYGDHDILMVKSTDGGTSWTGTPFRVNTDPAFNGFDQWSPALTVSAMGTVDVIFHDRRNDPANNLTMLYFARSGDDGTTFVNFPISDTMTNPDAFYLMGEKSLGDYVGIDSVAGTTYVGWGDGRLANPGVPYDYNSEVYFDKVLDYIACLQSLPLMIPENLHLRSFIPPASRPIMTHLRVMSVEGFDTVVTLSVKGLPGGATYSFTPTSGVPPFETTLNITINSAEEGIYEIQIAGTYNNQTLSLPLELIITSIPYILLETTIANPGDNLTLIGHGFTPSTMVEVFFDGKLRTSGQVDPFGSLLDSLPLLENDSDGNHTILVRDEENVEASVTLITYSGEVEEGEVRDIAIIDIQPSKPIIGAAYPLLINVTVENQGTKLESFNITVYANDTSVATKEVTLIYDETSSVTLTWETTEFPKGNYTLYAYVIPLTGETDTADNAAYASSQVRVTIPGDVDGDRDVDIFDIVRMAEIYGVTALDKNYDPNCDIDGDGDIDIFDIVAAAGHYGESW